jgi:uncharacterized membrane protein
MNDMGMGQGQGGATGGAVDPQDAANNKVMAVLCYIGILWLAPFFMAKQSPFVRYHLNQGLLFLISAIVVNVITGILAGVLGSIVGALGSLVSLVGTVYFLVFAVIGCMNAWTGKAKPLPVIGGMMVLIK